MANQATQPEWIPNTATFGARLALVRWHMSWNIAEAERECNLSQNTWANWEEGASPRNYMEVVNRIVLRTRVNKMWRMDGSGSPETPETPTTDYGVEVSNVIEMFASPVA